MRARRQIDGIGARGKGAWTHGTLERRPELELVEADEPAVRVHDAVVVVHGQHEAAGEGVAVHPGDGGHGVGQEAAVEAPEAAVPEGVADADLCPAGSRRGVSARH